MPARRCRKKTLFRHHSFAQRFADRFSWSLFGAALAWLVTARRLHDIGRSGWWILFGLIPLIGTIVLLVFMVLGSQEGENRFGPNPKEATAN